MSSSPEKRPRWAVARPMLLSGGLVALVMAIAVACGGGDDGPSRNTPQVVMETFTPTVEGATPPANATRDAQATEAAATATYVAENPPPPPPTRDPNATQVVPTVDPDEDGMRPPRLWLNDGERTWEGAFGNFSFVEESTGTVANAQAPFYDVGDEGLTVSPGGELEVILQEDVEFPSSMTGPPESATVEVFTWENNNAIPTGTDGSVEDRPWFVPAETPLISSPVDLGSAVLTMPAQPDRYVVRVQLTWPNFEHPDVVQPIPIFAVYAFTVYVE